MSPKDIKPYRRAQLDKTFDELRGRLPAMPIGGWIAEIRSLLLMKTTQLARRVGVSQSVVSKLEKSEREKKITLQSLENVADALECDLHYFFVPRKGLENELYERAEKLFLENEKRLEHHMSLEGQSESVAETAQTAKRILEYYNKVWD